MFDETILTRWLDERSDIALKKLMNNEPLTFEDNFVFAIVGLREEMKRFERRVDERFKMVDERIKVSNEHGDERYIATEKRFDRLEKEMFEMRKEIADMRKEVNRDINSLRQEITVLTRWILTAIVSVPLLMKVLDIIFVRFLK